MRLQVFSEYLQLAQAGKLDFLACPMHIEDKPAVFPLLHKEDGDKVVLYCLACSYKNIAGQQLYENIKEKIRRVNNEL
jgi:hypothetical protein